MANKDYTIYYTEPGLSRVQRPDFYNPTDPENNNPIPPGHDNGHDNGHDHEIHPSHSNHMIHYNDTSIEDI